MENENYFDEAEYIRGFNVGYRLTQESPEFSDFLATSSGKGDRLDGMKDGRQQYLEEQFKEKALEQNKNYNTPSWLENDRFKNLDKGFDKSKSKDIEPDL